jgi:hypothetical protein
MSTLGFEITDADGYLAVTPTLDDIPLSTLVAAYENAKGYTDPAGGYGGLVPAFFSYGPLESYFLGQAGNQGESDNDQEIYLLACECGELGCWPLMGSVVETDGGYRWEKFNQPHRPSRDYSGFGPFEFSKADYESEIRALALKLETLVATSGS